MEGKWWSEKDGKVTIVKLGLIRFLTEAGYAKLPSKESFRLIQNEGNIVREVSIFAIRDFILDYLQENDQLDVMKEFVKSDYLNKVVIESLPTTEIEFHRDSDDKCFLYFQNIAVEITEDSFTLVKYENLEKPIWQDWKIDRNINGSKYTGCLFEDFIQKVTTHSEFTEKQHQKRIKSLESIMGYLIHRFRSRATAKAIVLTDMTLNEDGIANGRTGKGIFMQAISHLRRVLEKDAKLLKPGKSQFHNQDVDENTDIVFYDDASREFNFDYLYGMITTSFYVEEKYKKARQIPFELSPKIVVASNHPLLGQLGPSTEGRKFEFEFTDYFGLYRTPEQVYNQVLFDDWDDEEWNQFYLYVIRSIQGFLRKGLVPCFEINLAANRLRTEIEDDRFIKFVEEYVEIGKKYDKKEIHDRFLEFIEFDDFSSNLFTRYLAKYAIISGYRFHVWPSNGKRFFTLTEVH